MAIMPEGLSMHYLIIPLGLDGVPNTAVEKLYTAISLLMIQLLRSPECCLTKLGLTLPGYGKGNKWTPRRSLGFYCYQVMKSSRKNSPSIRQDY